MTAAASCGPLDRGTSFIVTRNGVPVAELTPFRQRMFVPAGRCRGGVAIDLGLPLYTRNPDDFAGLSEVLDIVPV